MTNLPNYFPAFDRLANTAVDVRTGRHNNTCVDRKETVLTRHLELLVRDTARTWAPDAASARTSGRPTFPVAPEITYMVGDATIPKTVGT